MARARNIKPALFKNEVLGVADPMATLLFEGLWLLADREGRLEDRVLRIKAELFPYRDNVNVDALLSWLAGEGFIHRYVVDGKRYIEVDSFVKHQNPHKNEPPSEIPSKSDGCIASDFIGTTPDKIGSAPADSLSLDSGFLTPDSLSTVTPPASPMEDLFAKFWKLYPNKKGKAAAEKAWAKLRVSRVLFDQMLSALSKQALTPDWTKDKGRFVPHPATWLNGKRWEDEIPDAPGSNVHPFPHSRHTGFDQRDYKSSLKQREDGSYAI